MTDERDKQLEGQPKIQVLGFGNLLMGDDGFGPYAVQILRASYRFDPCVLVEDAGTLGLNLTTQLAGAEAVIVLDTVTAEGDPGSVQLFRGDELRGSLSTDRLGPHDAGLERTLLTLDFQKRAPGSVLLIGVIANQVERGIGLSPAVRGAAREACREVVRELNRLGHPPQERLDPEPAETWWET